ncbi:MAG: hypothetical protein KJO24_06785 [Gammaproteobacteria bacterium]|nr:hypothetical protein [Gammaproteobacteria bacterium]
MHQQVQKQLINELCGLSETLQESITTPLAGGYSAAKHVKPALNYARANTPGKVDLRRNASSNAKSTHSSAAADSQYSLPLNEV